jgi:hypothetical protein
MFLKSSLFQGKKSIFWRRGMSDNSLNPLAPGIKVVKIPSDSTVLCFPLIDRTIAKIIASLGLGLSDVSALTK